MDVSNIPTIVIAVLGLAGITFELIRQPSTADDAAREPVVSPDVATAREPECSLEGWTREQVLSLLAAEVAFAVKRGEHVTDLSAIELAERYGVGMDIVFAALDQYDSYASR